MGHTPEVTVLPLNLVSLGPGAFQEGLVCVLTVWVEVCPGKRACTGAGLSPMGRGKETSDPRPGPGGSGPEASP